MYNKLLPCHIPLICPRSIFPLALIAHADLNCSSMFWSTVGATGWHKPLPLTPLNHVVVTCFQLCLPQPCRLIVLFASTEAQLNCVHSEAKFEQNYLFICY